jgi:ribosome-associated protein
MDDGLRINGGTLIPLGDVVVRASRSSGPGGQHANMTSSRIEVSVDVRTCGGLSETQRERVIERCGPVVRAVAQDARSQSRNRLLALERLTERLRQALHVQASRRPTKPTKGAKKRRLEAKGKRGQIKRDRRRPGDDG